MLRAWANIDGKNTSTVSAAYTNDGTRVTVVLDKHEYLPGHIIRVSAISGGGLAVGNYSITSSTLSTFSFLSNTFITNALSTTPGSGVLTIQKCIVNSQDNIHSVTKTMTGGYGINFKTPMIDSNFCPNVSTSWLDNTSANMINIFTYWDTSMAANPYGIVVPTNTSFHIQVMNRGGNPYDANYIAVSVFR